MTDPKDEQQPEVWLRGPKPGIPPLLQPVAHTLLQAQEEIHRLLLDFPEELLWEQPMEMASPAFHLQHISGVLDRLFTYASGDPLSFQQLKYLSEEGLEMEDITVKKLLAHLDEQIKTSLEYLKNTNTATLTAARGVGKKQLPSSVLGLLFHAAEHTMRHTGQLLVTVKLMVYEGDEE